MEKQPTATDFLLQCSQKLAIKCGKGGLKDGIIGNITIKSTGDEFLKLMSPRSQQKEILQLFQSENIMRKGYLKSIGIK
uniref:Uncharacterized protein n=1 Tax=Candidatus Methanogaster sp. ANME-2c ERB4 TaxID=2759911 RepID=A0A7G9YNM5_9EURY|nr:hypothetical protein AIHMFPNM_00010 [Methanosarcinales archaeon ANME-2c ERB4]